MKERRNASCERRNKLSDRKGQFTILILILKKEAVVEKQFLEINQQMSHSS